MKIWRACGLRPVQMALATWRALPLSLRHTAHRLVQAQLLILTILRAAYIRQRGLPSREPVYVAGFFSAHSGIGQSARLFADALEADGVDVRRLDVEGVISGRTLEHPPARQTQDGGLLVTFLNPPELERWLSRGGLRTLRGRRHFGYWFWELPEAPATWGRALRFVDAVICQSQFTAEAIRVLDPASKVHVLPHPIFMVPGSPDKQTELCGFGDACVVLTYSDFRSTVARKNPGGSLEAYMRAVPTPDPKRTVFVHKSRGANSYPDAYDSIRRLSKDRSDVLEFAGDLTAADMHALIARCDIAISLHRSEGFGMLAAEAMWLGKPTVVTGWSGVLEFVTIESAALVAYQLVPVSDDQGIYSGGLWAEPDIDDAASKLKELIGSPDRRRAMGASARTQAIVAFDRPRWLQRAYEVLELTPGSRR